MGMCGGACYGVVERYGVRRFYSWRSSMTWVGEVCCGTMFVGCEYATAISMEGIETM